MPLSSLFIITILIFILLLLSLRSWLSGFISNYMCLRSNGIIEHLWLVLEMTAYIFLFMIKYDYRHTFLSGDISHLPVAESLAEHPWCPDRLAPAAVPRFQTFFMRTSSWPWQETCRLLQIWPWYAMILQWNIGRAMDGHGSWFMVVHGDVRGRCAMASPVPWPSEVWTTAVPGWPSVAQSSPQPGLFHPCLGWQLAVPPGIIWLWKVKMYWVTAEYEVQKIDVHTYKYIVKSQGSLLSICRSCCFTRLLSVGIQ